MLLVEPWFDGSHRAWAEGYQRTSRHQVALVTLPGRFWRWRLRGGAVTLAAAIESHIDDHGPPDVLLVSGLVDVAALVGLARRSLADVTTVLYLHENQVAYPRSERLDIDQAFRGWLSLLAVDRVLVNSEHHRAVLHSGLRDLLGTAPDHGQLQLLEPAMAAMRVVPVGVDLSRIGASSRLTPATVVPRDTDRPVVLWNHRWDEDKQPEVFVRALRRLAAEGVAFDVILAGEDAWDVEPRRAHAVAALGDRVLAAGHADRASYLDHLEHSDVVVSTAEHEFFGVAVVEALAAGCVPVLPHALSYPELVPERFHDVALHGPGMFRRRLGEVLRDLGAARAAVGGLDLEMRRFDWSVVAPVLDEELAEAAAQLRSQT